MGHRSLPGPAEQCDRVNVQAFCCLLCCEKLDRVVGELLGWTFLLVRLRDDLHLTRKQVIRYCRHSCNYSEMCC